MAEEKIEKGVISEETLEEIAGGLKIAGYDISKDTLKKVAIGAGVTVLGVTALAGIGYIGKKLYDGCKSKGFMSSNEIIVPDTHQGEEIEITIDT